MLDWDDLRFFLAIVQHRSLSAAAKHLHVTQSTVGRRLASLQASMGTRLLQRTGDGYILTMAGEAIRAGVSRIEDEVLAIQRAVSGLDDQLAGHVRIASSQLIASHLLATVFAELHVRYRAITIEAVSLPPGWPLATQDADIVIQMRPFEHHDVFARNIGSMSFGLYASSVYLARCGTPDTADGCAGHQLITLLDEKELSQQAAWFSEHAGRGEVVLRADSYETQYWTTVCGGGLAVLPRFRADAETQLRRIETHIPVPSANVALGVHRSNRDVPRVREVLTCVAAAFRAKCVLLDPPNTGPGLPEPPC